jgi:hypothetical protein
MMYVVIKVPVALVRHKAVDAELHHVKVVELGFDMPGRLSDVTLLQCAESQIASALW